jgi:hypothetical protein
MMKRLALIAAVVTTAMLMPGLAEGTSARGSSSVLLPSNGVYTCKWIAKHPTEATFVGVSCNKSGINPGVDEAYYDLLTALHPSDSFHAQTDSSALSPEGILSDGCEWVPGPTGDYFIGPGVYASTTFQYSNTWSWGWASSAQQFYWYVKRTGGQIQVSGHSFGDGGTVHVPANIYRWQVYNAGSVAQNWVACWDDD